MRHSVAHINGYCMQLWSCADTLTFVWTTWYQQVMADSGTSTIRLAVRTASQLLARLQGTWRLQGLAAPASDFHAAFTFCRCAGCFHGRQPAEGEAAVHTQVQLLRSASALSLCPAGLLGASMQGNQMAGRPQLLCLTSMLLPLTAGNWMPPCMLTS